MDDDQFDQFDKFVHFARVYLSNPDRYVDITAAEAWARGYLLRDQLRRDPEGLLARQIEKAPLYQLYGDPDGSLARQIDESLRDQLRGDPDELLARQIDESRNDKSAWDALNLIAQELIGKSGPLPAKLAEWTVDVLADQSAKRGHKKRPRPGKGGHSTAGRDWNCYFLIRRLEEVWSLRPTRNMVRSRGYSKEDLPKPCAEGGSGCDIVGVAAGIPKYKTVEGIWTRCSQEMRNS